MPSSDSSNQGTPTSSTNRRAKALAAVPVFPLFDVGEAVQDFFIWLMNSLMTAIFGVVGKLFLMGTEKFLFFTPPTQVPGLNEIWMKSFWLFWSLLTLSMASFFLAMQLFPYSPKTDPYRMGERILAGVVMVFVSRPLLGQIVELHNVFGKWIMPSSYNIQFLASGVEAIAGGVGGVIAAAVFAILADWSVLFSVAMFYIILAMRMLLIYTVYGLFPLFAALWIVDVGPGKYGKMVAEIAFKLTAILLVMGILVSGILGVTGAIAGQSTTDNVEFADDTQMGVVSEDGTEGGVFAGGTSSSVDVTQILAQIFAYFGGIWLSTSLVTGSLGMLISMRGGGGAGGRGGGGAAVGGAGAGAGAGAGGQGGVVVQDQGGQTLIKGDDGTGVSIGPDGSVNTFSGSSVGQAGAAGGMGGMDAAPEPTTVADFDTSTPLSEKGAHMAGQAGEKLAGARDSIGGSLESAGDSIMGGAANRDSKLGAEAQTFAGDSVKRLGSGIQDYASGSKLFDKAKGTWDKVPGSGQMEKAAAMGAAGAMAYHQVFKQKGVRASVAESKRMAEESKYGKSQDPDDMYTADHTGKFDDAQTAEQFEEQFDPSESGYHAEDYEEDIDMDDLEPLDAQGRPVPEGVDPDAMPDNPEEVFDNTEFGELPKDEQRKRLGEMAEHTQYEDTVKEAEEDTLNQFLEGDKALSSGVGDQGFVHAHGGQNSGGTAAGGSADAAESATDLDEPVDTAGDQAGGQMSSGDNAFEGLEDELDGYGGDPGGAVEPAGKAKDKGGFNAERDAQLEEGAFENHEDFEPEAIDNIQQNPDEFEGEAFDLEGVKYVSQPRDMADNMEQKGKFVKETSDGSTKEMKYVSFEGGDPPQLEDGATYNVKNVKGREWDKGKNRSHSDAEGKYMQANGYWDTEVEKVESGPDSDLEGDAGDVWNGNE